MKCPKCNQKLVCGCSACLVNFPAKENEAHMLFTPDGNGESCPTCGFTQHCDGWLYEDIKQLKEQGLWPISKEKK